MAMIKILNQINHINHIIINGSDNFAGSNGYLYLCGYLKSSYTSLIKKTIIFYYPTPNTTIVLDPNNVRLSDQTSNYNEATKLVTNGSNIFVSGTYDYTGFQIGFGSQWSLPPAPLYGTIDQFVFKTDATLTPASGWLSGVASTTTNISRGNTLAYDGTNNVYYLGGTFNGNLKFTGNLGQTISPYAGYDGYIGRFQDNSGADYKSLQFFKDSLSKAENSNVIVYPNPSTSNIKVASIKNEAITAITITDLTGRQVYGKNYEISNTEVEINISFLQSGNYFVNISTLNNKYVEKIVIIK